MNQEDPRKQIFVKGMNFCAAYKKKKTPVATYESASHVKPLTATTSVASFSRELQGHPASPSPAACVLQASFACLVRV